MIALGVAGGPVRESRESYTDVVINTLVTAASGSGMRAASRTAALETAASAWARALAAAEVAPVTAATRAVDPAFLSDVGRRLIRFGDAVYVIEVGPAGVRLFPASDWDVRGGYDPATWRYRVTLAGPDSTTTRTVRRGRRDPSSVDCVPAAAVAGAMSPLAVGVAKPGGCLAR